MAAKEVSPMPSYIGCMTDISVRIQKYFEQNELEFASAPSTFIGDFKRYCVITQYDVLFTMSLALLWTLVRYILTKTVFLPVAYHFRLTPLNATKFPESIWKTAFYGCTWAYTLNLLIISGKYNFFRQPNDIWDDWEVGLTIPWDIYIIYSVQFSFYLHSVYGTLFMDRWRKDSLVMIFHHFLTMTLIGFSFAARYHKIGVLVLFLHDIADVCLEFTKVNVYFKERDGKFFPIHDHISTVGFLMFASAWFIFRLYYFPLKVLYTCGVLSFPTGDQPRVPFYLFFNVLLWALQILNVYWFMFIVNFLVKVATGQMNEVDDIREEEVNLEVERKRTESMKSSQSGNSCDGDKPSTNGSLASKPISNRPKIE